MPIKQIEARLENDFERDLFNSALENLSHTSSKIRFNNFAYAIRELSRHILKRLAPDAEVKKCPWYKNITGDPKIISRSERIIYAIQGGLDNNYIRNKLGIDPKITISNFTKIIKELNNYTHINPKTFNLEDTEVEKLKDETLCVFNELFNFIDSSREKIIEPLEEQIDNEVLEKAIFETHDAIDSVATHHSIDEVEVYAHEISDINSELIYITAYGNIGTELQYGSNGDLRRGDGAIIQHSFPFTCQLHCSTSSPKKLIEEEINILIDESSWYE